MDKFVIRKPKSLQPEVKVPSKPKGQATLYSLKRVVVLEDIKRWKCILEFPNQTTENLMNTLKELKKKIPSEEVIRSTKIGEAVGSLQTHDDKDVSHLAQEVYNNWETFIKENRSKPNIEVRCDAATEKLRQNARRLLAEALNMEADHSLVECIEREVFHQTSRLINVHYRRTIRALVFALKHKAETRCQVKEGTIKIHELVQSHKK
ncbi:transcription elongation factor A N-terminal and central domain-containing protein 2 [Pelobates fuscus]|uniref:transcription elongation factor A N-terminal and central domain-containing protein 2 n=1 Tax=Pelobates fuscus TaxID=191477 RepID=UPI002FE496A9